MPDVPLSSIVGLLALRSRGLDLHAHAESVKTRLATGCTEAELFQPPLWPTAAVRAVLSNDAKARVAEEIVRWQEERSIQVVGLGSSAYPKRLLHLYDPPPVLFYQCAQTVDALPDLTVAVVGSRNCDRAGAEIAQSLATEVAGRGACIVSGLALGIDAAAHRGALSARATVPTVAVLGSGLSHLHPRTNIPLAREIVERGGMLLSEFEPTEPPYPGNFLRRNRIIAALAHGVIVVQAGDASGSLVTARHALELGREVMVIPGDIRDPRYAGSNRLLQQGAQLITSIVDIEHALPALPAAARRDQRLSAEERSLLQAIASAPRTRADLQRCVGKGVECEGLLLDLELRGLVAIAPGDKVELTVLGSEQV